MPSPDFSISFGEVPANLKKFMRNSPIAFNKAMKVGVLQFLEWSANGSVNDSSRPPIHEGFLRGSGSGFVGSEFVGMTEGNNRDVNRSLSGDASMMTIGYNSDYAESMHEKNYTARKDGERKWLENHIMSDKNALYETIGIQVKKELKL